MASAKPGIAAAKAAPLCFPACLSPCRLSGVSLVQSPMFSVLRPTQVELSSLPEMREEPLASGTYSKIPLSPALPLRDSYFLTPFLL